MTKYNENKDLNNIYTSSKLLVPYGSNLSSTVGSPRYTALERKSVIIPKNLLPVFIGILLSDANISRSYKADARLQFKQTINHIEYFYLIFFKLNHYCSKAPYTTRTIVHKKEHIGLGFTTRSLSCITELYNMFYVNNQKVVPSNLYDLLSWEALAHWIMGDGTYNSGVRIQTDSFTEKEVVFIINVLIIKFHLECSIHYQRENPVLYIKSKSIKKNLHNLLPYMHDSMKYKVLGKKYIPPSKISRKNKKVN